MPWTPDRWDLPSQGPQVVWAGPLALYSSRRITLTAPQYAPPPPPPPVRPSVLAGCPRRGRTSNLEPLLHGLRAGGLPPASLRGLAACLGGQVGEEELGEAVRRAVEDWREREGTEATLASFLLMLQRPEVQCYYVRTHEFPLAFLNI